MTQIGILGAFRPQARGSASAIALKTPCQKSARGFLANLYVALPSPACCPFLARAGDMHNSMIDMAVAQSSTGGVTQVLVHVSTYQGSILVPVF